MPKLQPRLKAPLRIPLTVAIRILCLAAATAVGAGEPLTLSFDAPELAGISGFRSYWDQPVVLSGDGVVQVVDQGEFGKAPSAVWQPARRDGGRLPGALVVDALHRRALVRFPGSAEKVFAKLREGYRITRVDLILPFRDTELWPFDYAMPTGMSFLGDAWAKTPPRWSVVAWPLRRPWTADASIGPTFNASISGVAYWERFGAQDDRADRFPHRFGPVEVSHREALAYRNVATPPKQPPPAPVAAPGWEAPGDTMDGMLDAFLTQVAKGDERRERPADFDQPARLDVTALLSDAAYGETVGERLRRFEACGLLLAKGELYDLRYKDMWSGYEWGTMTGGRGILLRTPRLEVVLEPAPDAAPPAPLPPVIDARSLAAELRASGGHGAPTAVVATPEQFADLHARHGNHRPDWMPVWQWQRVEELIALEATPGICEFPDTRDRYLVWLDDILSWPPRMFAGHRTPRRAGLALRHRNAMPAPVREHLARYWEGWLMPERSHDELVHPQAIVSGDAQADYLRRTDDWRGNTSYYRGYVRVGSTMNFNHTSVAGTLLGGGLIGAEHPLTDGRFGLEHLLLRQWAWLDGSTQETIDHYYFAITLFATKDMADHALTPFDRLMARSALTKYVDELTAHYHPSLRRFVATSGRTAMNYLLATQEGTLHVVHTLSPSGALRDVGNPETFGMTVIGQDYPPRDVASQTLAGPWAPAWSALQTDGKPLPSQSTMAFRRWGGISRESPHWRRSFLARHYGLATQDYAYGRIGFLAQWRRDDAQVERLQQLGTLLIRPGANTVDLVSGSGGALPLDGQRVIFQHRHTALVLTQPPAWSGRPEDLRSLQTTLGFLDFRAEPEWDIYVDGTRLDALPYSGSLDSRIVLVDGATYIGIVPLPATDLGREYGLSIRRNDEATPLHKTSDLKIGPALLVECYFLKKPTTRQDIARDHRPDKPSADTLEQGPRSEFDGLLDNMMDDLDMTDEQRQALQRIEKADAPTARAFGGVVVRMADREEFPDPLAFVAHLQASTLDVRDDPENSVVKHVAFRDGPDGDLIEAAYRVDHGHFVERRVNGSWPYLPLGIVRDTPFSAQGDVGQLDKNGTVLRHRAGHMAFLQAVPAEGAALALNPLPDLQALALTLPNGVEVTADGLLGLSRIESLSDGARLLVDHAPKPEQADHPDLAKTLLVFGMKDKPAIVLNGLNVPAERLVSAEISGRPAWLAPLTDAAHDATAAAARYRDSRILLDPTIPAAADSLIQDWYLAGSFPNEADGGFVRPFAPEKGPVDLSQTFEGIDGKTVAWRRLNPGGDTPVGRHGMFDLYNHYAPLHQWFIVYAYTRIRSDRDRDLLLLAGSDDAIAVWLNGEKLHQHEVYRALERDQERIPIQLRQGDNHLLLKIGQGTGSWGFAARLVEPRWSLPVTDGLTFGFADQ